MSLQTLLNIYKSRNYIWLIACGSTWPYFFDLQK